MFGCEKFKENVKERISYLLSIFIKSITNDF